MKTYNTTACIKKLGHQSYVIWIDGTPSTATNYMDWTRKQALSLFKKKHNFTNVLTTGNSPFNL